MNRDGDTVLHWPRFDAGMREPEINEQWGAAWRVTIPGDKPHTGISWWLLSCPWAHIAWNRYFVSVIHLRHDPRFPPPKLQRPDMTHELQIIALSDECTPNPDDIFGTYVPLHPANLAEQVKLDSDEHAAEMCRDAVVEVCRGAMSPDSDWRDIWRHWVRGWGPSS